ncbi:MAG TPA: alkaline phosphatase family protein [Candidatus Limnocylindria bacterium]|nr:alkaline phosphatase family protein [Candidatus Limnocylindria bacterium]
MKQSTSQFSPLSRRTTPWLTAIGCAAGALFFPMEQAWAKGKAEHVVVVVFDGMRPDFIKPQYCPHLYSLATNGVFFSRHHPVYISTTIVNGTALATGMYPGHSGIIANSDYRQELGFMSTVASDSLDIIRRGDLLTGDKYISVPTVAETIQDAGHHTLIAGTKTVAFVHDRGIRQNDTPAHKDSIMLAHGTTLPRSAVDTAKKANDDHGIPESTTPNNGQNNWTTKSLVHGFWKKGVPKYSLLWLSDPDASQHAAGVGSPTALGGIEGSDKCLGEVLKYLREHNLENTTDVMVVSDHGFSTVSRGADIVTALTNAKINAFSKMENPEHGDVMVVGLGGSALIYVIDRDETAIRKTVSVLQQCDFTGVIFSRLNIEGTFPLASVHYDGTNAPDIVVSMKWSGDKNDFDAPGMIVGTGGTKNTGTHGSLSRYDMNNTLVVRGPDFKKGVISDIPSGNIDLAPTILDILDVKPTVPMDGRVLREAYAGTDAKPEVKESKLEASTKLGFMQWSQYLNIVQVENATYYDHGNGESSFVK